MNRFHQLLTAALDNEISAEEQRELDNLLAASANLRREWAEYQKLHNITMTLKYSEPPIETWEHYWTGVYRRIERGVAWILVSLGAMVLLGYFGYLALEAVLSDPNLPWGIKGGIVALAAGIIILAVSVLREKMIASTSDKYKEVQR